MIERIKTEAELLALIEICNKGKLDTYFARLELNPESITRWIQEGKFKRLKEELRIYNNIKFGCLKNAYTCQYYFFGNKQATDRILNLITAILKGDPGHITDFKANDSWRYSTYFKQKEVNGQFNACLLF